MTKRRDFESYSLPVDKYGLDIENEYPEEVNRINARKTIIATAAGVAAITLIMFAYAHGCELDPRLVG